jgi:hypothetical protein
VEQAASLLDCAAGVAERDPLVEHLRDLCRAWPLSSVGVPDLGDTSVDGFIDDACLQRLYVDRILAQKDKSRIGDERVGEAVRAAIGGQSSLAVGWPPGPSDSHVAGARDRPVWLALPYSAEWRWMRGRADSPWYPRHRLFRQPRPRAWPDVFARIAAELASFPSFEQ